MPPPLRSALAGRLRQPPGSRGVSRDPQSRGSTPPAGDGTADMTAFCLLRRSFLADRADGAGQVRIVPGAVVVPSPAWSSAGLRLEAAIHRAIILMARKLQPSVTICATVRAAPSSPAHLAPADSSASRSCRGAADGSAERWVGNATGKRACRIARRGWGAWFCVVNATSPRERSQCTPRLI
jgi:hypothetical protein